MRLRPNRPCWKPKIYQSQRKQFNSICTTIKMKNVIAIFKAFRYSLSGIKFLLEERAFRQELYFGVMIFVTEILRKTTRNNLWLLVFAYTIVLITEAINTAIEKTIDRIGPEYNDLSKKAKDIGSAAVFIAIVACVLIWIFG